MKLGNHDQIEVIRLTRLAWAKMGYRPAVGVWPIFNPEDPAAPVIISRGQQEIHECPNDLIMVTGGVRAGKSLWLAMDNVPDLFRDDGLIWFVGPDYAQARHEFDYLLAAATHLGIVGDSSTPKHGGCTFVTTWGCEVVTKSSKEAVTLAGKAPNRVNGCEMGQQDYEVYEKLAERALQHNSKIVMVGTLEQSQEWYPALWSKWQAPNPEGGRSFSLPTWCNTKEFPGGREDPKIRRLEAILPGEAFLERCAAVPYKRSGLVHKRFSASTHVVPLTFDEKLPIELAIDPAQHTYAIEAVQWKKATVKQHLLDAEARGEKLPDLSKIKKESLSKELTRVYVIDEVYTHDMIAHDIIPIVQEKPWYPHVKQGVIDIAGTHRDANESQVEIWRKLTGIYLRSKLISIEDQIMAMNLRLRNDPDLLLPLILFDYRLKQERDFAKRPLGILSELGLYAYPDAKSSGQQASKPIDWANDGIKAMCYWLIDQFGPVLENDFKRQSFIRRYT
jgi:hypothetical protein